MPSIDDIAAEYVERAAALDPCYATCAGIAGHDHELTDLGADGFAGRAGLDRSTLAALDAAEAPDPREQVARAAMRERLALAVDNLDVLLVEGPEFWRGFAGVVRCNYSR